MSRLDAVHLGIALVSGLAVAGLAGLVVRPTPRLAPRVRPYSVAARTALGRGSDLAAAPEATALLSGTALRRMLTPATRRAAGALGRLIDRDSDAVLLQRLRQAGLLTDLPEDGRVQAYRLHVLSATAVWACGLAAVGLVTRLGATPVVLLAVLGLVVGATRWPARVNRAIDERRQRLRIELYTVNQLLALQVRAGSGVVQALQRIVRRGSGAVVEELAEVLALHRGGRSLVDALEQVARTTPEPNAARTYRLLAGGAAYGADLAVGLRTLSDDLRRQRAEALKRAATKRRAAMLVPIIAILAPVMLLFVAAPLPALVLGSQ